MNLSEYFQSRSGLSVAELKAAIGVKNESQVRQWQHGYADRLPSPANCVAIEKATKGVVTRQDLRPDDWQAIWPELIRRSPKKQESANA